MRILYGIVVLAFCFVAGTAGATTVVPLNLAQMTELAEKAFVLRVDSVETSMTERFAHDVISGTVIEPVFGDVVTSEVVTWKQFRFGVNRPMQGMPAYEVGKEYLVFLSSKASQTGFQVPIGLQQGAFDVIRNRATGAALVRNDLGNMTLASGLSLTSVAQTMAREEAATNRLRSGIKVADRAAELSRKLRPTRMGNSLDTVRDAARFFHRKKLRGATPSREFQITTGSAVLARPLHL